MRARGAPLRRVSPSSFSIAGRKNQPAIAIDDRDEHERADRRAEHPPRAVHVLAARSLADEDGRGHSEAEHEDISRNMTMLALDVAASAFSPRKRPTQIALMVPFSDWRIEETSVGSAKMSRVGDRPCVRSPPLRSAGH